METTRKEIQMGKFTILAMVVASLATTAGTTMAGPRNPHDDNSGQDDDDSTPAERAAKAKSWLAELGRVKFKAEPGIATATPQAPTWCAQAQIEGTWNAGGAARVLEQGPADYKNIVKAAQLVCIWQREPAVASATAAILQLWMNYTGLTQQQAAEAIGARVATDRFEADRVKLCAAIEASGKSGGQEAKTLAQSRGAVFGCNGDPMWLETGGYGDTPDELLGWMDGGEPDAITRLAWLTPRTRHAFNGVKDAHLDRALLTYVMDQVDYPAVTVANLEKALGDAPYKGNTYARAIALETHGRVATAIGKIGAMVAEKAKDAGWKELLVTAPQRGVDDWHKMEAKYKDVIARSREVERKLNGDSRSAMAGCWPQMRKDFLDIAKGLSHELHGARLAALDEPIAAFVFARLAACATVDQDPAYASVLDNVASSVRYMRGPRVAAYYAALEALGPIVADRRSFSIGPKDMLLFKNTNGGWPVEMGKSKLDVMGFAGEVGQGIVAKVTKAGDHVVVAFQTKKIQVPQENCVDTNRIDRIRPSDGKIIYRQNCTPAGFRWEDVTPKDVTVPNEWADGIKPGALLMFGATRSRTALPAAVYDGKKVVNWLGFGL